MTIDERLEALTMNLELTAREVADLRAAIEALQITTASLQENTLRFQQATHERFTRWEFEKQHLDEKVDSLADATRLMLTAIQAQQFRIERLESKAS